MFFPNCIATIISRESTSTGMHIGATNMAPQVRVKQGIVRICRNVKTCLTMVRAHNGRISFRASEISTDCYGVGSGPSERYHLNDR